MQNLSGKTLGAESIGGQARVIFERPRKMAAAGIPEGSGYLVNRSVLNRQYLSGALHADMVDEAHGRTTKIIGKTLGKSGPAHRRGLGHARSIMANRIGAAGYKLMRSLARNMELIARPALGTTT